jgi:phage-related protein (TIGR01555 family)
VVAFRGQEVPGLGLASWQDQFWGDPACQSLQEAVDNAELAQAGFAALVTEARLDIVKMPGLMQNVATEEYRERVLRRFELANLGKSTHRALVLDGEEEWAQRETSWAGIPEIIASYVQIVAGAADIPATRLLGKSPDGMNATGDGDLRNYETMISARQENDLRPLLERIDEVLIRSATGGRDPDIGFTFAPLSLPTAADEAGLFKTSMDAVAALKATGMVPDDALAKGVQNLMVERGWIPGLDGALAEVQGAPPAAVARELDAQASD